jgi:hypothetical protein
MTWLPVRGTVRLQGGVPLLVLRERLDGYDTFLLADLALDPAGGNPAGPEPHTIRVRVHTFDDTTVLHPARGAALPQLTDGDAWTGQLRPPAKRRAEPIPADLADALTTAGLPADLTALDQRERRHLLGYLADASDPAARRRRIGTIVAGLHGLSA